MGERKGDILFSGVQPSQAFLRRYTGAALPHFSSPFNPLLAQNCRSCRIVRASSVHDMCNKVRE